jgi:hypothetical protein
VAKWVAFAIVVVVPLLLMSDYGRRWLYESPRSTAFWVSVGLGAVGGGLAWLAGFPAPLNAGKATLVTIPFLQAVVFLIMDRTFRLLTRRVPVSFDEMRYGRRPNGRRHHADIWFWLIASFSLLIGGVFLCLHFEITLPSRHDAS